MSANRRLPKAGDSPRLGDTVPHPQEPAMRLGRIVGVCKDDEKVQRYWIRKFHKEDGWFPTGEWVRTWMVIAWMGATDDEV